MSAGSVLVAIGCRWRAHVSRSALSLSGLICFDLIADSGQSFCDAFDVFGAFSNFLGVLL